jgi:hypothetical protein
MPQTTNPLNTAQELNNAGLAEKWQGVKKDFSELWDQSKPAAILAGIAAAIIVAIIAPVAIALSAPIVAITLPFMLARGIYVLGKLIVDSIKSSNTNSDDLFNEFANQVEPNNGADASPVADAAIASVPAAVVPARAAAAKPASSTAPALGKEGFEPSFRKMPIAME